MWHAPGDYLKGCPPGCTSLSRVLEGRPLLKPTRQESYHLDTGRQLQGRHRSSEKCLLSTTSVVKSQKEAFRNQLRCWDITLWRGSITGNTLERT
ncbi:hypothetical protein NDU88_000789 [Pleurodeles waltl]|uniref:Uncharacterized protein n=1 Tax=Pleurodeles waltl TaxID=8319 RepID=A0AAV7P2B9_PLEWA|nr:hypothetical protein NDU88_000789 [Pleurodeles waltl]